jgi:hypothetical protein
MRIRLPSVVVEFKTTARLRSSALKAIATKYLYAMRDVLAVELSGLGSGSEADTSISMLTLFLRPHLLRLTTST